MSTNMRKPLVVLEYVPTHRSHLVYASGNQDDGSLYGFYTICHRLIDEPIDNWQEHPQRDGYTICRVCLKVEAAELREQPTRYN